MSNSQKASIEPSILLSIATSPFLLASIAIQSFNKSMIELGQASEEIFRGDRLPILHVPRSKEEKSD